MLDLLARLPPGGRVLDLGAAAGSFATSRTDLCVVRADLSAPLARKAGFYVSADAARLPFASQAFDVIVSNHSLEHFSNLCPALQEIGRVLKPDGALYVAVPNASTLTDRIYRWLARGGGHVNAFHSPEEVIAQVQAATGLPHRRTDLLFTSLSFLNSRNFIERPPRRIALFAYGSERFLMILTWFLRLCDRRFGTPWSHYGWAFYFGDVPEIRSHAWPNVCVRCGSGHPASALRETAALRKAYGIWQVYHCPSCGTLNLFTPE